MEIEEEEKKTHARFTIPGLMVQYKFIFPTISLNDATFPLSVPSPLVVCYQSDTVCPKGSINLILSHCVKFLISQAMFYNQE